MQELGSLLGFFSPKKDIFLVSALGKKTSLITHYPGMQGTSFAKPKQEKGHIPDFSHVSISLQISSTIEGALAELRYGLLLVTSVSLAPPS